jgi:hypothetical protein
MNKKQKIELMLAEIRNRGGLVKLSDNVTDELEEFFLEEILSCPDCIDEAARARRKSRREIEH